MASIPNEALFYIPQRDLAVRDLLEVLYDRPSQSVVNKSLIVNPHLHGDWIRAGQLVIVTPVEPGPCALWERQMALAAAHVDRQLDKLHPRERATVATHYALLSNLASLESATAWKNPHFMLLKQQIERAVDPRQRSGGLARRQRSMEIGAAIDGLLARRLFDPRASAARIKARMNVRADAAVHQWKTQVGQAKNLETFKRHYARIIAGAKQLTHFGQVSLALNVEPAGPQLGHSPVAAPAGNSQSFGALGDRARACHLVFRMQWGHAGQLWCGIACPRATLGGSSRDTGGLIYNQLHRVPA
ncbi:hypothetical protein ACXYTJ_08625 [Gilvimarinus sp. F26214L]|uniref:hypothetical protein n=1 Tax=Gilvimarinus sp. DZF01 TaxID=3461371 RepID=UPI004045348D